MKTTTPGKNPRPHQGPAAVMNAAQRLEVARLAESRGLRAFGAALSCEPVSFHEALRRLATMEAATRAYGEAARKHGLALPVSKALQEALAAGDLDRAIGVTLADALAAMDEKTSIQTKHNVWTPARV